MASFKYELIDGRKISVFERKLKSTVEKIRNEPRKIMAKYDKLFFSEGEMAVKRVVDLFYEDYTPNIYNRKEDLYNTFKLILIEPGVWDWDFSHTYMKYKHGNKKKPVSNEYIYENSFVNGYHGGAIDGKFHPNPGEPWWKTIPGPGYWYEPATQYGESPRYEAEIELKKVTDELIEQKKQDFMKITDCINDCYRAFFDMLKI